MQHKVKLDGGAAIEVQADGIHVALTLTVMGIQVQRKLLPVGTCGALVVAVEAAAAEAERYAAGLAAVTAHEANRRAA